MACTLVNFPGTFLQACCILSTNIHVHIEPSFSIMQFVPHTHTQSEIIYLCGSGVVLKPVICNWNLVSPTGVPLRSCKSLVGLHRQLGLTCVTWMDFLNVVNASDYRVAFSHRTANPRPPKTHPTISYHHKYLR